ncbi:MAG: Cof-type HAD-IIB family hydrolase [Gemmatimonadota bacterium]|nr:Cof-type HAD-IIB family hydrolase [Gemmatimonadota bacterium]
MDGWERSQLSTFQLLTCLLPYSFIAIDIDGTLLTSQRVISARTLTAIDAAIAAGKHVALCTGRSLHSGRPIAEQVHPAAMLVFHSGALILEALDGPILQAINMPCALASDLVNYLKQAGYDPLVYDPVPESHHVWYESARSVNAWRARYIEANGEKARLILNLEDRLDRDPAQIAVSGSLSAMHDLRTQLRSRWHTIGLILSRSTLVPDYFFLEIVPERVSKADALAVLGAMHGVPSAEMISIGDNFNDLDMIHYAGLGVAMDNAPEEVKTTADLIAPSNDEDGVAYIIENFLLTSGTL